MKTIELRTALQTFLKTLHSRVYFQTASDNSAYPYIVFDLPNSVDFGTLERFSLEIDFWDDDKDTTTLETLANTVDETLNRKNILVSGEIAIAVYRTNKLSLTDDDPRIKRRQYKYQVDVYQKYY